MADDGSREADRPLPAEAAEIPEVWVDWQLAPARPSEKPRGSS
jgi:hypothetical protein